MPWSCLIRQRVPTPSPTAGLYSIFEKSMPLAFQWNIALFGSSNSVRPTSSSIFLTPSWAIMPRASSATNVKYDCRYSALPLNLFLNISSCVATPTEQLFRLQCLSIMQPRTTSAAVANPNSSAPSMEAITMSRPVLICPSVCSLTRLLRSLRTSVWCVSEMPSSHGRPACFIELMGDAPVPPSPPEISIMSAWPLATPAAMVPTPISETSFTLTLARGFAFFKSNMSCARSSME